MQHLKIITNVQAPLENVWGIIGAIDGVDKWSPIINTCTLSSSAENGLERICSSAQGDLKEQILLLDQDQKKLVYAITEQQFFPIDDLKTAVTVTGNQDTTQIVSEVSYRLRPGASAEEIEAGLRKVNTASYAGIEGFISKTV